jgi:hypothetical protein
MAQRPATGLSLGFFKTLAAAPLVDVSIDATILALLNSNDAIGLIRLLESGARPSPEMLDKTTNPVLLALLKEVLPISTPQPLSQPPAEGGSLRKLRDSFRGRSSSTPTSAAPLPLPHLRHPSNSSTLCTLAVDFANSLIYYSEDNPSFKTLLKDLGADYSSGVCQFTPMSFLSLFKIMITHEQVETYLASPEVLKKVVGYHKSYLTWLTQQTQTVSAAIASIGPLLLSLSELAGAPLLQNATTEEALRELERLYTWQTEFTKKTSQPFPLRLVADDRISRSIRAEIQKRIQAIRAPEEHKTSENSVEIVQALFLKDKPFSIPPSHIEACAKAIADLKDREGFFGHLQTLNQHEIERTVTVETLFRDNSLSTAVAKYLTQAPMNVFVQTLLTDILPHIIEAGDLNVNLKGQPIDPEELKRRQEKLKELASEFLGALHTNIQYIPPEMKDVLLALGNALTKTRKSNRPPLWDFNEVKRVVFADIFFLRGICTALTSLPSSDLYKDNPDINNPDVQKTLELLATIIKNVANEVEFGEKESYMAFANDIVTAYSNLMLDLREHLPVLVPFPAPLPTSCEEVGKAQARPRAGSLPQPASPPLPSQPLGRVRRSSDEPLGRAPRRPLLSFLTHSRSIVTLTPAYSSLFEALVDLSNHLYDKNFKSIKVSLSTNEAIKTFMDEISNLSSLAALPPSMAKGALLFFKSFIEAINNKKPLSAELKALVPIVLQVNNHAISTLQQQPLLEDVTFLASMFTISFTPALTPDTKKASTLQNLSEEWNRLRDTLNAIAADLYSECLATGDSQPLKSLLRLDIPLNTLIRTNPFTPADSSPVLPESLARYVLTALIENELPHCFTHPQWAALMQEVKADLTDPSFNPIIIAIRYADKFKNTLRETVLNLPPGLATLLNVTQDAASYWDTLPAPVLTTLQAANSTSTWTKTDAQTIRSNIVNGLFFLKGLIPFLKSPDFLTQFEVENTDKTQELFTLISDTIASTSKPL